MKFNKIITFFAVLMLFAVSETAWAATSLPDAVNGVITLTEDVELTGWSNISTTVTLDLAGHGILLKSGGTISLSSGGKLTIKDSNPTGDHYITLDSNGRGTSVSDTSPGGTEGVNYIKVTGGYITGGGKTGKEAGCVYIASNSTFVMEGGTICGNTGNYAGGVKNNGTFEMTGGKIIYNTATHASNCGGGVLNNGIFRMFGGEISSNHVSDGSGGVYCIGTLQIKGAPVIKDNTRGDSVSNIELPTIAGNYETRKILVVDTLTAGANIHVTPNVSRGTVIEKGGERTADLTETEAGYFHCDDTNYVVALESGSVKFKLPLPTLNDIESKTYNGNAQEPTITFNNATLTKDTDYTVSYKDSQGNDVTSLINADTYTVTVTGIGNYGGTAEKTFTIVPFRVVVTAKNDPYTPGTYYTTFYHSSQSYVADCEVYYVTARADGRLTLVKADGNIIKAGEGVILKSSTASIQLTEAVVSADYDSLLTGSDSDTTVENALVLSLGENGVRFYKYSGTVGAHKAYLPAQ